MSVVRGGQFQSHRADRGPDRRVLPFCVAVPPGRWPWWWAGAAAASREPGLHGHPWRAGAAARLHGLCMVCAWLVHGLCMACALRFYGMCVARVWLVRGSCMVSHRHWHVFCTNHARIMHHDLCHVSVVRLACIIFCISVSCTSRPSPMSNNARRAHTLAPASRAAGNGTGEDAIAIWVYG